MKEFSRFLSANSGKETTMMQYFVIYSLSTEVTDGHISFNSIHHFTTRIFEIQLPPVTEDITMTWLLLLKKLGCFK
jgi:hypothetical protein